MYTIQTMKGYGVYLEVEADLRALEILRNAGYNPYALCRFIGRMTGETGEVFEADGLTYKIKELKDFGDGKDKDTDREQRYAGDRVSICLSTLAHEMGIVADPGDADVRTERFQKIVYSE